MELIIGVFHSATTWPILLLVHYGGFETLDANSIPWSDLCAATAFAAGQLHLSVFNITGVATGKHGCICYQAGQGNRRNQRTFGWWEWGPVGPNVTFSLTENH